MTPLPFYVGVRVMTCEWQTIDSIPIGVTVLVWWVPRQMAVFMSVGETMADKVKKGDVYSHWMYVPAPPGSGNDDASVKEVGGADR